MYLQMKNAEFFIALVDNKQAVDGWLKVHMQYHLYKDFLATLSPN